MHLQTRVRCRQNGTVAACGARLEVDLDVSFSSCPKFIQSKHRFMVLRVQGWEHISMSASLES